MQHRFCPRPTTVVAGAAFDSAQDAWLWAAHAVKFATNGANLTANRASLQRPCEPRDIIALTCRLRREKILSGHEFGVLCRYGAMDRPPDPRDPEEEKASRLWDHALDKLTGPLIRKGIVEAPFRMAQPCRETVIRKGTKHE